MSGKIPSIFEVPASITRTSLFSISISTPLDAFVFERAAMNFSASTSISSESSSAMISNREYVLFISTV